MQIVKAEEEEGVEPPHFCVYSSCYAARLPLRENWCEWKESNLHGLLRWFLRPVCLPFHHTRIGGTVALPNNIDWSVIRESNPSYFSLED